MEDYVTVDGNKIFYVKEGDQGEVVLLVHGIPTSSFLWRNVQAKLAPHYQVYAVDMLGYGKSDKPVDRDYSVTTQSRIIDGFADALGLRNINLACHDQGGAFAMIFAAHHIDKVSRFIFMNGVAYDYWPVPPIVALGQLKDAPDSQIKEILKDFNMEGMREGVHYKEKFTDDILSKYAEPWKTEEGFRALTRVAAGATNKETTEVDLSRINVPALIIWGMKDPFLPFEIAERLSKDLGGSVRIDKIENAGHFLQEDVPDRVADLMHSFISG